MTRIILILLLVSACAVKKQKTVRVEKQDIHQEKTVTQKGETVDSQVISQLEVSWSDQETDYTAEIIPVGEVSLKPDGSFEGEAESITIREKTKRTENSLDSSRMARETRIDTTSTTTLAVTGSFEKEDKAIDKSRPAISLFVGLAIFITLVGCALIVARKLKWI